MLQRIVSQLGVYPSGRLSACFPATFLGLMLGFLLLASPAVAQDRASSGDANPELRREVLATTCVGCHGPQGQSQGSAPSIAGLSRSYLLNTMQQYKQDDRHSTVMGRIAKGYTDEELETIAAYYAQRPFDSGAGGAELSLVVRGAELHRAYECNACHGPVGVAPVVYPEYPRLAGQPQAYLEHTMASYAEPSLPIGEKATIMRVLLKDAKPEDIRALAAFYASQMP